MLCCSSRLSPPAIYRRSTTPTAIVRPVLAAMVRRSAARLLRRLGAGRRLHLAPPALFQAVRLGLSVRRRAGLVTGSGCLDAGIFINGFRSLNDIEFPPASSPTCRTSSLAASPSMSASGCRSALRPFRHGLTGHVLLRWLKRSSRQSSGCRHYHLIPIAGLATAS